MPAPEVRPLDAPATGSRRAAAAARPGNVRRPLHVPVIIGISAGVYAGSLALCSMLQIETDRALIEDRRPVADAIRTLGSHHDRMASELLAATRHYADAASAYEDAAADTAHLSRKLNALARRLAAIDSITFDMSAVTGTPSYGGGYAGGTSSGGSSSGGGGGRAAAPRTAPLPPPPAAAPPPTNGSTGASGAP